MQVIGNRLRGKKIIVTGASKGIGAAIATKFVNEGADVLVNYNSSGQMADELIRKLNGGGGGHAIPFRADVSKIEEIKSMVRSAQNEFGRIDVLVNNAVVIIRKNFLATTEADFERIMSINLKGPFFCSQEVAPLMIKQGKGKIINVASISGLAHPSSLTFPDYVASKAGIIGLTRSLAVNLGPQILVNAVSPGATDTDMISSLPESSLKRMADEAFLKRLGRPEDIANGCVFLASDESDFITGEVLTVSGGRGMR